MHIDELNAGLAYYGLSLGYIDDKVIVFSNLDHADIFTGDTIDDVVNFFYREHSGFPSVKQIKQQVAVMRQFSDRYQPGANKRKTLQPHDIEAIIHHFGCYFCTGRGKLEGKFILYSKLTQRKLYVGETLHNLLAYLDTQGEGAHPCVEELSRTVDTIQASLMSKTTYPK